MPIYLVTNRVSDGFTPGAEAFAAWAAWFDGQAVRSHACACGGFRDCQAGPLTLLGDAPAEIRAAGVCVFGHSPSPMGRLSGRRALRTRGEKIAAQPASQLYGHRSGQERSFGAAAKIAVAPTQRRHRGCQAARARPRQLLRLEAPPRPLVARGSSAEAAPVRPRCRSWPPASADPFDEGQLIRLIVHGRGCQYRSGWLRRRIRAAGCPNPAR